MACCHSGQCRDGGGDDSADSKKAYGAGEHVRNAQPGSAGGFWEKIGRRKAGRNAPLFYLGKFLQKMEKCCILRIRQELFAVISPAVAPHPKGGGGYAEIHNQNCCFGCYTLDSFYNKRKITAPLAKVMAVI